MLSKEHVRADIECVKNIIAIRERINSIQQELRNLYKSLDTVANDVMEELIARGAVTAANYVGDNDEDLAG